MNEKEIRDMAGVSDAAIDTLGDAIAEAARQFTDYEISDRQLTDAIIDATTKCMETQESVIRALTRALLNTNSRNIIFLEDK